MRSFDDVVVYEDVFDRGLFNRIYKLTEKHAWHIQISLKESKNLLWRLILNDEKIVTEDAFSIIKKLIGNNYAIRDVYMNAQAAMQSGDPHPDSDRDSDYTFLIYMNQQWDLRWSGHTIFFNKYWDKKTNNIKDFDSYDKRMKMLSFLPIPNTGLFFPSNIIHYGEGPSKLMEGLRFSLAYKLERVF